MKNLMLAALAASFLTLGCATPEPVATTTTGGERVEEGEVVTGSRIPRRSIPQPVKAVGSKEISDTNTRIIASQPKGVN